jgi:hypothetical protein
LSRWRRLINVNFINSCRIISCLDLAQKLLVVEGAGFFWYTGPGVPAKSRLGHDKSEEIKKETEVSSFVMIA